MQVAFRPFTPALFLIFAKTHFIHYMKTISYLTLLFNLLFLLAHSVLCSALMYDLKLRDSTPTRSPNRKQFVSKVLPQLTGLQELAREKEIMSGSDDSVTNSEKIGTEEVKDGSRESDERKEAIKRLKTSENSRLWNVNIPYIFYLFIFIVLIFI